MMNSVALIAHYFLIEITCSGFVANAFYSQIPQQIWINSFSRETTIPPRFLSKETIKASITLPLRAGDENQFAPLEDFTTLKDDADDEESDIDELVSSLNEKLEQVEGIWYSDDFYGPHGREWVNVSATLIGDTGTSAIVAVKITGDPYVPSGCTTWKTLDWPELGGSNVPAKIQIRVNPKDPNGFSWVEGEVTLVSKDLIVVSANFSPLFKSKGRFHRRNAEEDGH